MSFSLNEESTYSGRPIELYEFTRQASAWRYNNSDRNLTYKQLLYKAVPISNDGARFSSDAISTEYKITLPVVEDFCQYFVAEGTTPADPVYLKVRRAHAGDISRLDSRHPIVIDAVVVWVGSVSTFSQIDEISAQISCNTIAATFDRGGLRYGYQRSCPHVLYATNTCRASKTAFRILVFPDSVLGTTVTSDSFADFEDGWFSGGFIEYRMADGSLERRFILSHTGNSIVLSRVPPGLVTGVSVSAYPGCDRTVDTCIAKFDNLVNFGGFPHLPGRNPFDGQPLF